MTKQFLRLSNRILRRQEPGLTRLADVGLYALLSTYLSIPSFRTPNGGMRKAIAKHCRNGRHSRDVAWKHLYAAGFLKRSRFPDEKGNLKDLYTLLPCADFTIPPRTTLKITDGRAALAAKIPMQLPKNNYTSISYQALQDPHLSLETKGLYALLCYHLEVAKNSPLFTVSREHLLASSGVGACAFRRMWNELKQYGYLQIQRGWDHASGRISYCYAVEKPSSSDKQKSSLPSPPSSAISKPHISSSPARSYHRTESKKVHCDLSFSAKDPSEFSWIKEGVEVQLEYDVLLSRGNKPEFLDMISDIITEILLLPPESILYIAKVPRQASEIQAILRTLEAEDIESVLSHIKKANPKREINNLRMYLLTCLCHIQRDNNFQQALPF